MEKESIKEAREFWNRFDLLRGSRTVKEIAESIGVDYELIRVQRTRQRTPKLTLAVSIANELGTTVEHLVCGGSGRVHFAYVLYDAYRSANERDKSIIDTLLGINRNKEQTEKMSV